ncbi:c-type cytochrome [Mucilaginibacter mali]|uniref:Photosynthetic reaction center cytochrome c subunit n=1 Tax=Mucilaginibacter mali TaxID=2740462 RepID=A0A7D4PX58_9SPHI|nr:c-type cytochrome [Mucilaginibacter mali]QKJ32243.1 c-type cytochrome [Mucilaginibacter mali]
MIRLNKKHLVIAGFGAVIALCVAATPAKPTEVKYTNLKVLPKNISPKELQGMMVDDFQDGLGVTCNFCHANAADGHGLDFASDAKPEKEIARAMMRMTIGLNKKYFKVKHPKLGTDALVVNCNTCHKGQAFPDGAEPK